MRDTCKYCRRYNQCSTLKKNPCEKCKHNAECDDGDDEPGYFCGECNFHDYIKLFGFDAYPGNCPIDCESVEAKKFSDDLFGLIMHNSMVDVDGNVLYVMKNNKRI